MSSIHQQNRLNYIHQLFVGNPDLFNHDSIPLLKAPGSKKVVGTLPLNNHLVHGETHLYIYEKLAPNGVVEEYRYGWEFSGNGYSKQTKSITAFDKQTHPEPPHNNITTDPYHHHYVTGDLRPRCDTGVQNLKDVINILKDYLISGIAYQNSDRFY